MSRLEEFLALPNVDEMVTDITMDRLGTFTVKPLSPEKHQEFQNRCRTKNRKTGDVDFNMLKFNLLVISNQVINPNFSDANALQTSGFQNPRDLIEAKFKAGEIFELAQKICEISGFDTEIEEVVEEAKN